MLLFWTCMQTNYNQHNEFGPQIIDKDDVEEINDKDDVGAGSTECVVDELVEVDNDEGSEISEADR